MFTVSRQRQWPDGGCVVEISSGGIDYCNPDALGPKYSGELAEYESALEAVETAITVSQAWQADSPNEDITIGMGATGGMTMPFDGEPLTEATFAAMREQAKKHDDALPRCDHCGETIYGKPIILADYGDDWQFCREYCAEGWYSQQQEPEEIEEN